MVTTRQRLGATLLALIASGVALWWLLSEAGLAALVEALHRAPLWQLAAAWALVPVVQGLRAWRFSLLASGRLAALSWPMYVIAARLLLFNYLLPFKLGEVSFPFMMRQSFGTEYLRSTGILIVARLMDLCVVSAILAFGVVLVIDPALHDWDQRVLVAAGVGAMALPLLGLELLAPLWRVSGWLRRAAPSLDHRLWQAGLHHPLPQRALAVALTLAIWTTQALLAYLAASAVADRLDFFEVMLASAAANLAFALPVSGIAGLGPPQAAWATTLHLAGVAWSPAIVSALICHGVLLTGALGLGALTILGSSGKARPARHGRRGAALAGRRRAALKNAG